MAEGGIRDWMAEYGWEDNPFSFRIYRDLMIGYEAEQQRLQSSIESASKFTLLIGETGAGKTNMLRNVQAQYQARWPLFYMPKPPTTQPDFLTYLRDEVLSPGIVQRWFNSYSLYNIHDAVNDAFDDQLVLFVDEGHEASREVLEQLRTAMDHINGLTVVAAGLPQFEDRLQEEVPTLYSRATETIRLESLNRDNTIQLVRSRIEQVGGSSTEPFTQDALLAIFEETDGFPREVLRVCNDCVVEAAAEDKTIIDAEDVHAVVPDESPDTDAQEGGGHEADESADDMNSEDVNEDEDTEEREDVLRRLTPKQRTIYDAVEALDAATSGDIVEHIGVEEYKSREHAIRSVNNILRRLMEQDLIERERRGRTYLYDAT